MKILLLSDSHGNSEHLAAIKKVLAAQRDVDALLFAGDGHGDMSRLNAACPVYEARGNCDLFSRQPDEQLLQFGDIKLFLTHGHLYGIKHGLSKLAVAAKTKGARVAIYGHTHLQEINLITGVHCINPGALSSGEYAILYLDSSGVKAQFFHL
ncbi:MAG: metallophosphoesterase [Clostridiales bacterium]|nr:metallophosphoesterase [Clostridiales bacterium]